MALKFIVDWGIGALDIQNIIFIACAVAGAVGIFSAARALEKIEKHLARIASK